MKIPVAELERKSKELMMRAGAPERSAQYIAETLVSADLRGISSHGVVVWPGTSNASSPAGSWRMRRSGFWRKRLLCFA